MKANSQRRLAIRIRSDARRFESLKREIVQLDYFCKGTVLKRMMKCGNKQCICHHDPAKRHGPYFECTYKIQNKTNQPTALPRSDASLSSRHPATSQVEVASRTHGTTVTVCSCAPCSAEVDPPQLIKTWGYFHIPPFCAGPSSQVGSFRSFSGSSEPGTHFHLDSIPSNPFASTRHPLVLGSGGIEPVTRFI